MKCNTVKSTCITYAKSLIGANEVERLDTKNCVGCWNYQVCETKNGPELVWCFRKTESICHYCAFLSRLYGS